MYHFPVVSYLWFGKISKILQKTRLYLIVYDIHLMQYVSYVTALEMLEVCRYCVTGGQGLSVTPTIAADSLILLSHHIPPLVVILRSNLLGRKRLRRFLSPRQRPRMAEVHGWLHWTYHDIYCELENCAS